MRNAEHCSISALTAPSQEACCFQAVILTHAYKHHTGVCHTSGGLKVRLIITAAGSADTEALSRLRGLLSLE